MTPIILYLTNDELPLDKSTAQCLWAKAARFTIFDSHLLRMSFSEPYLRCVTPIKANHILVELHQGEYDNHAGGCNLINRAFFAGYYWPTIRSDSTNYVKRCDSYQRFVEVSHLPLERLTVILSPWPFMKWEINIVRKLAMATGQ